MSLHAYIYVGVFVYIILCIILRKRHMQFISCIQPTWNGYFDSFYLHRPFHRLETRLCFTLPSIRDDEFVEFHSRDIYVSTCTYKYIYICIYVHTSMYLDVIRDRSRDTSFDRDFLL